MLKIVIYIHYTSKLFNISLFSSETLTAHISTSEFMIDSSGKGLEIRETLTNTEIIIGRMILGKISCFILPLGQKCKNSSSKLRGDDILRA